jgi:hypothetical protein
MGKFLKRLCYFFIPLSILSIFVLIIDPYNYFFSHNLIPDSVKFKVINRSAESMPRGNTLWKYIDFERHPQKNIIIGDSRAYDLKVSLIKKITNQDYYNFGVPGANYKSIIETFWYVTKIIKPDKIYLQVGFHTYSASNNYDLMADAKKVCKSPYLFFTRIYFLNESMLDVYHTISNRDFNQVKSDKFDEAAWNKTLKAQEEATLINRLEPTEYYNALKEISDYCKKNNIELNFIIFPDQKDYHDLIISHSKENEYIKYKEEIHSLGNVIDFDLPESTLILDRNNYRDIYHLKLDLIDNYIIPAIWKN